MKKITAILAILLFAITTQAQVKIFFNGFHCYNETDDGSGSDEIYFIVSAFKDGKYVGSTKLPENSYYGGVDGGGTYAKNLIENKDVVYNGGFGNIMLEVVAIEWDRGNPNDRLTKYIDFYTKNPTIDEFKNIDLYNNTYKVWNYNNDRGFHDKDLELHPGDQMANDDEFVPQYVSISKKIMLQYKENALDVNKNASDADIDRFPYNFKVPTQGHPDGKLAAFFSFAKDGQVSDQMRAYWEENDWIGKYVSPLSTTSATFENATLYKFKQTFVAIQGTIREKYRQKGIFEKVGNLESNEMDVTDQKWKDAGYLKFNKFSKGYIVWKPSSCLALTEEEFNAGPKTFTEIVTEAKTKEPAKIGGILVSKNAKTGEDNRETAIAMITNYMATNQYAKDNLGSLINKDGHPRQTTNKDGKTGWFWATTKNNGFIFYTPFNNQVHFVDLGFRSIHAKNNTEHGVYGFAISDPFGIKNGGVVQQFEFGNMYYWLLDDHYQLHGTYGKINEKYSSQGWENGNLGYPLNDEYSCPIKGAKKGQYYAEVGHAQFFEGGAIWYKLDNKKAYIVPGGPIIERYKQTGWEVGDLGYPKSDAYEWKNKGGMVQSFEDGDIRWKNGATEAFSIKRKNNLYSIYLQNQDKLGFPVSEELNTGGTVSQAFENGNIVNGKVIFKP